MSDDSYTWACPDLVGDHARRALDGLRADLVERGIIDDRLADCILSVEPGHPPGPRIADALEVPAGPMLGGAVNGLEMVVGREVTAPWGDGYDGTVHTCRSCGSRHDFDAEFGDLFDEILVWRDGGALPIATCPSCAERSSFADLDLSVPWCLAESVVRVWNWYIPRRWFIDLVTSHLTPQTVVFANRI